MTCKSIIKIDKVDILANKCNTFTIEFIREFDLVILIGKNIDLSSLN